MSLNQDMRMECHTVAKNRIWADYTEWTYPDILAQFGGLIDDCCWVNDYGH